MADGILSILPYFSTPILSFSTTAPGRTPCPARLLAHSFPVNFFPLNGLPIVPRDVIRVVDIFF